MNLPKYSMGIGDRFGQQGKAQLQAFIAAGLAGVQVTPVWNKSNREHTILHSEPASVREEADAAVRQLGWNGPYFVDADHIALATVDRFLASSDFFTIDVADAIGKPAARPDIDRFVRANAEFAGSLRIAGIGEPLVITTERIAAVAEKYLFAVQEAARVYRHIERAKGLGNFVPEMSMDETHQPQTPIELLFILAAAAQEKIPLQTIAPRFSGRFNKGVDYLGDVAQFEREFNDDLAVIAFAVRTFGLPENLKLSVHSGSDKFSIYPAIGWALNRTGAGLHLKTAGTTWLEELTGLALAGADGLEIAKEIYARAVDRFAELCGPYASVIEIDRYELPSARQVGEWTGRQFADALRHDPGNAQFNPHLRQLLHVAFKVAAQMGQPFIAALSGYAPVIAENVTTNLYARHLKPVFIDSRGAHRG